MQRNFCKHSTDNSDCCLNMSCSPLRREDRRRRDKEKSANLRERSGFHRSTIASSAKRVPRGGNARLQTLPECYPRIPVQKLTNTRAPQIETLVRIMRDRYGDVRLEDKMEMLGDLNVAQHETRPLKPIMKETVIADCDLVGDSSQGKGLSSFDSSRYERLKGSIISQFTGDGSVNSERKYIFDILRPFEIRVELIVLNGYKRKCRILEIVEVRADKSNAVANHELIPLIRPSSKACNKKRVFAPLSCNETFNVGSNVIRMQRQIEIEDQQVAHLFYLLSDLGYVFVVISGSTNYVTPFTWSRVNNYDMKNIRREHNGHPPHLCADRISLAELSSQPLSQQFCGELTARSPSAVTAISKRSFCDRLVSTSSIKTARSSTSVNNSGLTDTSAGGGSESASSEERSPSVLYQASFKADETPSRRSNASLYDKQTPSAGLQTQQTAMSTSTIRKPITDEIRNDAYSKVEFDRYVKQIGCPIGNNDGNIVIEEVDKHGFWAHLELEMCIEIENKENENMQVLRTVTNRIRIGECTVFETQ
uniref:Uncharacterized protein n=1 Tax=Ascaris lumbricoides TaxID=6252 RepID=A0A9J2PL05_ASCLU